MADTIRTLKIGLASDHGGFELKEAIALYLKSKGYNIINLGTFTEESVDYPEFSKKIAESVISGEIDRGIAFCGTGIGISIALNKFPKIRAALCHDAFTAKMSRLHNDANVLAIGGRNTGIESAKDIVDTWLTHEFEGGRHARRIGMIDSQSAEFWKKLLEGDI